MIVFTKFRMGKISPIKATKLTPELRREFLDQGYEYVDAHEDDKLFPSYVLRLSDLVEVHPLTYKPIYPNLAI